ncbi:MAG: hypothetical protein K1X72_08055 [Pyrinomonadaceae bacterium]|nr:hypothetical protein [Pyrinomonadaceae bacterium]
MSNEKELELKERELALKEKELGLKENGSKGSPKWKLVFTVLIILLLLSVVGFLGADKLKQLGYFGTGNSKELELKEKELALKEKELELKQKSSKESNPVKAENTNKTETVKATETVKTNDSAITKGCQPTNAVNFKKGTSGQTFKCQMSGKNGQHKYTLDAKAGQIFNIQFESNGAGTAPYAVYKIVNPDGVLETENEEGNTEKQLDKTGKWTVTVDLSSSATNPSAEYTITFTIGGQDGS